MGRAICQATEGGTMKIAVIGAGFAGLSAAKVLREFDHEVVVFDKAPDVGGVWSVTRRYPGLRTQNDKSTYALSDLPMPRSYPQWPTGAQVQAYLESYVDKFGLGPSLRLGTEVTYATPVADGWEVTAGATTETFGHLVVANGIFSEAFIPPFDGVDILERAGGRLLAACDFHDLAGARGKHVVVVGYGKSACDVSREISKVTASTTVVARELLWKMPKKLKGVVNYKYLILTRLGEGLFRYQTLAGAEKFLHGKGDAVRRAMLSSVESVATRQLRLAELGLVPDGTFEDIARSTVSLATDGFYAAIVDGRISVLKDNTIRGFLEQDGRPYAELTDGPTIPADLVVCGTGFRQQVPFFDEAVRKRLTDGRRNFELYRQILPHDVPNLTFAGYNSSLFSPLSAEMSALWIASHLAGLHQVPPVQQRRRTVAARIAWMEKRTNGHHARGTNIIPFSMHNIDEVLSELDLNIGKPRRAQQWLLPVNPHAYRNVAKKLKKRYRHGHGVVRRGAAGRTRPWARDLNKPAIQSERS
jgi:dimethylaniline monooxygenase (N-oxide forming)